MSRAESIGVCEQTGDENELPRGWASAQLEQIAHDISYGYTASAASEKIGPHLLRITDIQNGAVNWDTVPFCDIDDRKIENYRLKTGDLVFARTGATTGKSFLIRNCPKSVFASYLIRVRPEPELLPEYVAAFFRTQNYWNQISENISGSAQPNCNASKLASLVVPIAPLPEQRRVVAKLELLLGKVSASRTRLSRVSGLLKRFRQSVLAAACTGKLTVDWREQDKDQGRFWAQGICEVFEKAVLDGCENPDAANIDEISEVPASWPNVRLGSIIENLEQGWSPGCDVAPSPSPDIWGVMKTTAVQPMAFWEVENKRLPDHLKPRPSLELRQGDLLITRAGPRIRAGVCCLIRSTRKKLILCDKAYRFRAIESLAIPRFLEMALNAPGMVNAIDRLKTGTSESGMNLTQSKFLLLLVGLPPLAEQREIVRRVEKLFAFADQIEARLKTAQAHVNGLTQSILAKAFRGELVPQDPNDEPASKLLERIQTDRENPPAPSSKRTSSKGRKRTAKRK